MVLLPLLLLLLQWPARRWIVPGLGVGWMDWLHESGCVGSTGSGYVRPGALLARSSLTRHASERTPREAIDDRQPSMMKTACLRARSLHWSLCVLLACALGG